MYYYGQKTELFLDDLSNQELDNLRDHKHSIMKYMTEAQIRGANNM